MIRHDDAERAAMARGRLEEARARATQVVQELLRSLQHDQPQPLDEQVTRARHELDLLWQAVGRVTEPA